MTIVDWFIQGLGYGACALGMVLMFFGMLGALWGFCGKVVKMLEEDDNAKL